MADNKKRYFTNLNSEQNNPCDYKFKLPFFGESKTDQSFYEPNASRISNMKKSASGLSTGVYDFDQDSELVIISLDTIKMLDASLKSLSF